MRPLRRRPALSGLTAVARWLWLGCLWLRLPLFHLAGEWHHAVTVFTLSQRSGQPCLAHTTGTAIRGKGAGQRKDRAGTVTTDQLTTPPPPHSLLLVKRGALLSRSEICCSDPGLNWFIQSQDWTSAGLRAAAVLSHTIIFTQRWQPEPS